MSPEQSLEPKKVTVRSDIFSLGVTLFELFTGMIIKSPHQIFKIMNLSKSRIPIIGKLHDLGIKCGFGITEEYVFSNIFEMFQNDYKKRPTSSTCRGKVEYLLGYILDLDTFPQLHNNKANTLSTGCAQL